MALQCAGLNMRADPDRVPSTSRAARGERLDSWKEIADHLRRGLTTVQRWERQEGLPIHRHVHSAGGSVFAYVSELDRWLDGREPTATVEPADRSIDGAGRDVPGGAMSLESPYYIPRDADHECRNAVARRSVIVLIDGPPQVGKSSLLARVLADARDRRAAVAFTDIQALGSDDLLSLKTLYHALGRSVAAQIKSSCSILQTWNDHDSPNTNFSRYMQRLLASGRSHVVWGLDAMDQLVGREYAADVFSLLRSWRNMRALDPTAQWSRLTLVMACATDGHPLIADARESPFNVGVRTTLDDFSRDEVTLLNDRHGTVVKAPAGLNRVTDLLGGHPYLLQCAFDVLSRGATLRSLEDDARSEAGPFGEHLDRLRLMLPPDPLVWTALDAVSKGGRCGDRDSFHWLKRAGIVQGGSPATARLRCALYRQLWSES